MRMQMLCRTALCCVDLSEWTAASELADRLLQVRAFRWPCLSCHCLPVTHFAMQTVLLLLFEMVVLNGVDL